MTLSAASLAFLEQFGAQPTQADAGKAEDTPMQPTED